MPVKERERLFAEIARKGFEKDVYSHTGRKVRHLRYRGR